MNTFPSITMSAQGFVSCVAAPPDYTTRVACPKHFLWQEGTTTQTALSNTGATTQTITVANGAKLTAGRHAIVRPSATNWGGPGSWEIVYVQSVNGNSATITRAWKTPLDQDLSLRRNHAAGSYIATLCMGGVAKEKKPTNGTPSEATFNWKFNHSTTCPTDASGKKMWEHAAAWAIARFESTLATYGRCTDGYYNDVDWEWLNTNAPAARADADADGVADHGLSSLTDPAAVNHWRDGKEMMAQR